MKRLAMLLIVASVIVPAGIALRAQEKPRVPTNEKLDDLINTLKNALAETEGKPGRQPIRFELRLYDIRDLIYPISDYPGTGINLVPSGGFGFGFSEEEFEPVAFYEGDAIADMVRDNIAPESWDELSSVDVQYRESGLLLVKHTPGVHGLVAAMLAELRKRAASQVTLKVWLVKTSDATLRGIVGGESPSVIGKAAEARLATQLQRGTAEVIHEGSITCTNTQRVALTDYVQVSYLQDYDVEIAEGAAIADPIVSRLVDGYIVDIRSTVAGEGDLVILQVRTDASRLVRPMESLKIPLGTIETPELQILKLQTTLALPLGATAVVGGALDDGDEGGMLLLVTPQAIRFANK